MTALQRITPNPIAHLTAEDIENLGAELDAIREQVIASRGERDAAYIRSVIDAQRKLELGSRAVLLFSLFPPAWLAGTAGLSVSKIIENMEIGHNVMHGQWDWMRDPRSTPPPGSGTTPSRRSSGSTPTTTAPHLHQRPRQGQRPRLRHHARRRGPALEPCTCCPAAVQRRQRLLLPVRHRLLRPEIGKYLKGRSTRTTSVRARQEGAGQDPPPGHPRLRAAPAAVRALGADHADRQRHRQPGAQPVDPLGHLVRPLPRGRADLRQDLDRGRDPRRVVPAPDARLGQHLRKSAQCIS